MEHKAVVSVKIDDLAINNLYSFDIYPTLLIGSQLKRLKYVGRVTARNTRFYGIVAKEEFDNVYDQLPAGVVDDAEQHAWLLFESASGDTVVLCQPWIDESTIIAESSEQVYTFRVKGNSDVPVQVRYALNAIGIYDIEFVAQ